MKYTWNRYLSACERECPENLSFPVLTMSIPFYEAFKQGVAPRRLMAEIVVLASLDWLTIEQRQERIRDVVAGK